MAGFFLRLIRTRAEGGFPIIGSVLGVAQTTANKGKPILGAVLGVAKQLVSKGAPATADTPEISKGPLRSRAAVAGIVVAVSGALSAFGLVDFTPDQIVTWTERLFYVGMTISGLLGFYGRWKAHTQISILPPK